MRSDKYYATDVQRLIPPEASLLDLGAGVGGPIADVPCAKHVKVDAWKSAHPDVLHDLTVVPYPFDDKSFDIVAALDCIEHLDRAYGYPLLLEMQRIARHRVIIFTPNYFASNAQHVTQPSLWCYKNEYNYHKSLWTPEDFPGWTITMYDSNLFLAHKLLED